MSSERPAHPSTLPLSLASIQVDVATRLGAPVPVTPTGLKSLDAMLGGGLRAGTVLCLSGAPGSGRTALSLLVAYMAARTRAGVVVTSVHLDETEVVARLAARAINREYPAAKISYATIWTGEAFAHDETRRVVNAAVETVHQKVGGYLHVVRLTPGTSLAALGERLGAFWARHERVLVVMDDIEAALADSNSASLDARVLEAAFALRALADRGSAVLCTCLDRHADLVAPAATVSARIVRTATSEGDWGADLVVTKNRLGPVGVVPLHLAPGTMQLSEGRQAQRA